MAQQTESSVGLRLIKRVQFGILSPDEVQYSTKFTHEALMNFNPIFYFDILSRDRSRTGTEIENFGRDRDKN